MSASFYRWLICFIVILGCGKRTPFVHASNGDLFGPASVKFEALLDQPSWTFRPGKTRWTYRKGRSVWSTPTISRIDKLPRVFIGSYDHHLYCLDGLTGKKVWSFIAGSGIFSTPLMAPLQGGMAVIFGCEDRTIYAVSAKDGNKIWAFQTVPWNDTISLSKISSGTIHDIGTRRLAFFGVFNNDRSGLHNVQQGELVALDVESGQLVWRERVSNTVVNAPCIGRVGDQYFLFISCRDGIIQARRPDNGKLLWRFMANDLVYSSPSFGVIGGRAMVFYGTRNHSVYALDATTGKKIWTYRVRNWVDSTPTLARVGRIQSLFFGSYDRGTYSLDASTGQERWKYSTGNWISSSACFAKVKQDLAVFITSLDGRLYAFDAESGKKLWSFHGGPFQWSHFQKGDAQWASPIVSRVGQTCLLVFPSFSYQVHGFVEMINKY